MIGVDVGVMRIDRLEHYKPMLDKRTAQLADCVGRRSDAQGLVDLGECIQHWSYDVMVRLVYCTSPQCLTIISRVMSRSVARIVW